MDDFFVLFRSLKAREIGEITSAIIGLILLFLFFLNFYSNNTIIPANFMPYFLGYFVYLISLLLITSITEFTKSTVKGKTCHYCGSKLEIFRYKCKNPKCGREQ